MTIAYWLDDICDFFRYVALVLTRLYYGTVFLLMWRADYSTGGAVGCMGGCNDDEHMAIHGNQGCKNF